MSVKTNVNRKLWIVLISRWSSSSRSLELKVPGAWNSRVTWDRQRSKSSRAGDRIQIFNQSPKTDADRSAEPNLRARGAAAARLPMGPRAPGNLPDSELRRMAAHGRHLAEPPWPAIASRRFHVTRLVTGEQQRQGKEDNFANSADNDLPAFGSRVHTQRVEECITDFWHQRSQLSSSFRSRIIDGMIMHDHIHEFGISEIRITIKKVELSGWWKLSTKKLWWREGLTPKRVKLSATDQIRWLNSFGSPYPLLWVQIRWDGMVHYHNLIMTNVDIVIVWLVIIIYIMILIWFDMIRLIDRSIISMIRYDSDILFSLVTLMTNGNIPLSSSPPRQRRTSWSRLSEFLVRVGCTDFEAVNTESLVKWLCRQP